MNDAEVDREITRRGLRWERRDGALVRQWRGLDFAAALAYTVRVGELAEEADHHPDIDIRWNVVILRLVTHSAGGITSRDLDLAAAVDALDGDAASTAGGSNAGTVGEPVSDSCTGGELGSGAGTVGEPGSDSGTVGGSSSGAGSGFDSGSGSSSGSGVRRQ